MRAVGKHEVSHFDPVGQVPHGRSHEGGILLMAADDQLDLGIEQRNEDRVDLCAGNAENMGDSHVFQHANESFSTIHGEGT